MFAVYKGNAAEVGILPTSAFLIWRRKLMNIIICLFVLCVCISAIGFNSVYILIPTLVFAGFLLAYLVYRTHQNSKLLTDIKEQLNRIENPKKADRIEDDANENESEHNKYNP